MQAPLKRPRYGTPLMVKVHGCQTCGFGILYNESGEEGSTEDSR